MMNFESEILRFYRRKLSIFYFKLKNNLRNLSLSVFLLFIMGQNSQARNLVFLNDKELQKVCDAITEALTPDLSVFPKNKKNELIEAFEQQKTRVWEQLQDVQDIKFLLTTLGNMRMLHSRTVIALYYNLVASQEMEEKKTIKSARKKVKAFLRGVKNKKVMPAFYDLSIQERRDFLNLLLQSEIDFHRRIGFSIRTLISTELYEGPISELVSGIKERGGETIAPLPERPNLQTHLRYIGKKKRLDGEIDYLVIGSGAAGAVVASELQKAGHKVLVLEKGPFMLPGTINTSDNFAFLEGKGLRSDVDGSTFFLNGEIVGGGITVNIDMSFPPSKPYIVNNIERWRQQGKIPKDLWTQKSMANAYEWVQETFQPRVIKPFEVNENNAILVNGARKLGIPFEWYELNKYAPGASPSPVTGKVSTLERLIYPAMTSESNPMTLLPNSDVIRVLTKRGHAIGVEFKARKPWIRPGLIPDPYNLQMPEDQTIKVYAKNIIVSAGNLGSSSVLLRSDIKNKNIGKGYVSHPFIVVAGIFDHEINAHQGEPSTVYIDNFISTDENPHQADFLIESAAGNPNVGPVLAPGTPEQIFENMSNLKYIGGTGVILPEKYSKQNQIKIGPDGKPRIFHYFAESDQVRMKEGLRKAMQLLFAAGAKKVMFNTYEDILGTGDRSKYHYIESLEDAELALSNLKFTTNNFLMMGAHMSAGNKLGTSSESSVVDGHHRVWGYDNLYVVDGSVFPETIGANPMQTIYTIAKLFADRHLGRLTEQH